ncbi:MAG: cysteine desulfurase [Armatimonadota bacterium]|nr:cysteine desulfurase [Armatimonadota bacterium]MDR7451405.1 cysteine desulfurase [Armatimonadota bacterium]MDR7466445.1 cysteine desulfurase [Armatimonadota bacterium]MDR7493167.1 cysteine desulfurase [Armatimonadota bacterium]MDR7500356.1 cysteine desulfurase [Armatimonadota bacterium]
MLGPRIRDDFPLLARQVHGRPLVYLDSAATSQKPRRVIEALVRYYQEYNANVHRGIYRMAEQATEAYEGARAKVAAFIGATRPEELIFTRSTTEAINLVAYSWGRANIHPGDEILLTEMEHHSNLVPWQLLAAEREARLRFVPFDEQGLLRMEEFDRLLSERTKLVAVTHQSNVLGTINPVRELAAKAHTVGAAILVDGAQSAPHMPVDVRELGVDFFAFSAHKMCGPTGAGALWGRYELLEAMPPFHGGGEMIMLVQKEQSTYKDPPHKFEAGTPSIADCIVWGEAVDYLREIGMEAIRDHEVRLVRYAMRRLAEIPGLRLFGPENPTRRGGTLAFDLEGVHPHDVAQVLDQEGVAVRAGHHCAQPLHRVLGVAATTRASLYLYNTEEDIDRLVSGLQAVRKVFSPPATRVPGS